MSNKSFVIYMHMADGHPNGVKIVEKSNWSGVGLYIPRTRLSSAKSRPELQKPGVYILLGDLDLASQIYIGEGDPLLGRLISHEANKDFWNVLIAFTSKDFSLNKAIIQYLESRLCSISGSTGRFDILNKNNPKPPSLSEMDLAVAEGYLQELLLCLPVLGVSLDKASLNETPSENRLFIKNLKGVQAIGIQTDSGFTVFKGSQASFDETNSLPSALKAKRSDLIGKGIMKDIGKKYYEFTCDFSFGSPSTAAGVIQGRSANGRTEWKNANGVTIKELEEERFQSNTASEPGEIPQLTIESNSL